MSKLEVFVVVVAVLNVVLVIEFVRRRKLLESFALLWLAVGFGGVALGFGRPLVDRFADFAGIDYGPTLVFALVSIFLLFACMSLSVHVTQLRVRVEALAEEIAFLRGVREPDRSATEVADD
jgi:hypothetical protein